LAPLVQRHWRLPTIFRIDLNESSWLSRAAADLVNSSNAGIRK
jgi:hypothetical protein